MNRTISVILYIALGISSEYFWLWLFPFTGLGGLICYPTAILLSVGFGFLFYKLLKKSFSRLVSTLLFLLLFVTQSLLQIWMLPQEMGGNALSKIGSAVNAYKNYDKLIFSDFSNLNTFEKVIFVYKYKKSLPTSFITLTIDSGSNHHNNPRTYVIQNIKNIRVYDKKKINIVENDTATLITEFRHTDTMLHKMNRNFMNIGRGGYGDSNISLYVQEDKLEIETGIEKLLYRITSLTKKPI